MTKSKIPWILGIIGIVVGFAFMAGYFYDLHYNPFHFPTEKEQIALGGYSPPPLYNLLEGLMFAAVPGLLVFFLAIGVDGWAAIVLWVGAVLLNGPIYFALGLLLLMLTRRMRKRHT